MHLHRRVKNRSCSSMKFGLHRTVRDASNHQFKHQVRTLNLHVKLKVKVLELDALGGHKPLEQAFRHIAEVCPECADCV